MKTQTRQLESQTMIWLAIGLALLLVLMLAPTALADGHQPLGADPLLGNLRGNPWAGSSELYQVAYSGGNEPVTIRVRSLLLSALANEDFGFNLYGPNGYDEQAPWNNQGRYREQTYRAEAATTLTVQVYNYSRQTIPYEIAVLGLGDAFSAEPLNEVAPAPLEPATVAVGQLEEGFTVYSDALLGDSAGRFAEYRFNAVAGERLTITLDHQPVDPSFGRVVSFRAYGSDGQLAAKGVEHGPHHWQDKFVVQHTGEYVLQVQNYGPGLLLNYTLTISR